MQRKRFLISAVALAMLFASGTAFAHQGPDHAGYDPADGPPEAEHQHGAPGGHLPASSHNVGLVGKVELTNVPGGVADVSAFGNFAYLNAFNPECAGRPGAQGTGVHVVDISNPANPVKVNFLPSEPNSYQGEGVHVISFRGRQYLLNNNETCNSSVAAVSGISLWDVTDPLAAVKLGQFGDPFPSGIQVNHSYHSAQGFVWQDRAYAVGTDNNDLKDVDIFDITPLITGAGPAVLVAEQGLEDWPGAQGSYANGNTVFHHDMQQKVIGGHNFLLISYWDAGQVLLNVDDPANPVFVTDSDYTSPDPEFPDFAIPEGNSHQSYFDQDGEWILSSDEDFSPTRTLCRITTGPNAGETGCGEFGWTVPLSTQFPGGFEGSTVFGGSGCEEDLNDNGVSDRSEVPSQSSTGADAVVFQRGVCFFSKKVESGELAGYRLVIIGQSHAGSRNGLVPDSFICGGQGSPVLGIASATCIGHQATHLLFNDAPAYSPPEGFALGGDLPPIGTLGERISARGGVFDGWGYVHLHDATQPDLPEIDTYAVAESHDPAFASGFGNLTVHEVKTDPRRNKDLAYLSYYDAGLRVVRFGAGGIQEVGHFVAEGGNDFWGTFPLCAGQCLLNDRDQGRGNHNAKRPLLLMSDRDSGLWIFRYTGKE